MPNTTPIPELIAIEIEERLNTILIANGYSFDVSEVVRPNRRGENWKYQHLGIGIRQEQSQRFPSLDCPGNPPAIAFATSFSIVCICKDSSNLDEPHATSENQMTSAVTKAITSVGADWHLMDGVAVTSELGSPLPLVSQEGELPGAIVPLIVIHRQSETDPFEVRG